MDRWRGRVAVVTGASAGIGAAICKLLAKDGMKVVGCARRQEKVEEIAQNHPNIYPRKVRSEEETKKVLENLLMIMAVSKCMISSIMTRLIL